MGYPVSVLFKKGEDWIILCERDTRELPTDEQVYEFTELEVHELKDRLPGILEYTKNARFIVVNTDEVTGETRINPFFKVLGEYDFSATADHQANLKIDLWRYLKSKKYYIPKMLLIGIVLLALSVFVTWAFALILIVLAIRHLQMIQSSYNMHYMGELLPGIVISEKPLLVASIASLSVYGDPGYKVVKVQKLHSFKKVYKKGRKIPLSGSYNRHDEESPFWNHLHLYSLAEVIPMSQAWAKVYEIPQYKWDDLQKRISAIEHISRDMYLPVVSEEGGWKNHGDEELVFWHKNGRIEKVSLKG